MKEQRALAWLTVAAILAIAWLAHPFGAGLLLGTLLGFTCEPVCEWLQVKTHRPGLSAVVTVVTAGLLISAALVGFASLFITRAVDMSTAAVDALKSDGPLSGWLTRATSGLARFGLSPSALVERLEAGAGEIAQRSASFAGSLAAGTFSLLLGLLFAMLAMYVVLRQWHALCGIVVRLTPLEEKHTRLLLDEFRRVGRITIAGTVVTGLAQGLLAALGFLITGVPQWMFFGVVTAFASLLPGIGTLLVWVPAGLYLFATGHEVMAVVEWVWGALVVVGFSDYVIRPRLVGDEGVPALLVFVALFGGLEVFGLSGLIAGPVLIALAVAVIRLRLQMKLEA
ncbi:MAG: AI-2E family transporter [Pseudomonadota bacterium]